MEIKGKRWKVRDKGQFLLTLMEEFESDAHVSFEGDPQSLPLSIYPGVSFQPTEALKRGTLWPKQDFIVVPLELSSSKQIYAALGGAVPKTVLHIQIEKDGVLQFGAYDHFHPQCIFFGSAVRPELVASLVSRDILQPLAKNRAESGESGKSGQLFGYPDSYPVCPAYLTLRREPNYSADGGVLRLVTVYVERGNGSVYRRFWTVHEVQCFSQRME